MTKKHHKPYSLRRRLLLVILGSSLLLWLLGVVIMVAAGFHVTNRMLDNNLREVGRLIMVTTHDLQRQRGLKPYQYSHPNARLQYQIIRQGELYSRTSEAPDVPFVGSTAFSGFANVEIDKQRWRVFVTKSRKGEIVVQIGQRIESRIKIVVVLSRHLIGPALLWLIVLGVVCMLTIRNVLRPLEDTAVVIARKSPQDLTPVDTTGLPLELLPLTSSLNAVLGRLQRAMESERRFTADAAHELRTPLAALRTQTQLMQRKYPDMAKTFQRLVSDIDRCTRLVSQLLLLARLDPANPSDTRALVFEKIQLDVWLPELLKDYQLQAQQYQVFLSCTCDEALIQANPELLRIAVGNLIDNAMRYCPAGSLIAVSARRHPSAVELCIADDGNGVPQELWGQLAQRFYRILGNQQPGSGLGLSIVQQIAAIHQGEMEIGTGLNGRGLGVTLRFPACF